MDPYKILGVERGATDEEIKSAYKKLALVYHPDQPTGSEEKFKEISQAYNDLKSGKYQESTKYTTRTEPFWSSGAPTYAPLENEDVEVTISLNLSEVINGAHKKYKIKKNISCQSCVQMKVCHSCQGLGFKSANPSVPFLDIMDCQICSGKGYIKENTGCTQCAGKGEKKFEETVEVFFRKGSFVGMKYKLAHQGVMTSRGVKSHVIITVGSIKSEGFTVKGLDIHSKIGVSYFDLVLGGEISLSLPDGTSMVKEIAPGTLPGSTIILEKQGMPKIMLDTVIRGDFLVEVEVGIPEISDFTENKIKKLQAIKDLWNSEF
jgi:molecular chaperone DnaJ